MQGAFSGASGSRAAFTNPTEAGVGTTRSFSGEGHDAARVQLGLGAQALEDGNGLPDDATTFYASDPVLTGSNNGSQAGIEIHGDLASPLEQTAAFFSNPKAADFNYQYDDGQTPSLHTAPVPGALLGQSPDYAAPTGGFPDSTKGMAGLPELQPSRAAFSKSGLEAEVGSSPFPSVSDGLAYSPKQRLNPDLHAVTLPKTSISFETFERNAQRERYRLGISISQAGDYYQQDLRNYRRSQAHLDRKTKSRDTHSTPGGQMQEIIGRPTIR